MKARYKIVIVSNEIPDDEEYWAKSCKNRESEIDWDIINLTCSDWFDKIESAKPDYLLAKPPGLTAPFKQLYDERIYILSKELKIPVYPSLTEILIYENKRFLSFWLKANNIPHPATNIFYNKREAADFILRAKFPIVAKINIGASGKGVEILRTASKAISYLNKAFSSEGIASRVGPNMNKGNLWGRGLANLKNPKRLKKLFNKYQSIAKDRQRGFVIFQDFVPHQFEWRVVRIGDSFFAHKKVVKKGKASGSLIKGYDNPPLNIFDFTKKITDKHRLYSQAVDIFELSDGQYLVNEMQCIFGQSDPYQMLIDGKPGRYTNQDDEWVFEEGDFNTNKSYDLRLDFVIRKLAKQHHSGVS
jgi:glutathione synthase/RimK-type ligase-like ATP-grasp enzyme